MTRTLLSSLWVMLLLAVAGCRGEPEQAAPAEPGEAVQALAQALRDNDLKRFQQLSLPPALYEQRKALWSRQVATASPVSPEEAERYARWMQQFTAEGAEADLMTRAEPKLQAMEAELGPTWDLSVGMASSFATAAVAANTTLSDAEKAHLDGLIDAGAQWAKARKDFVQRDKVRAAIGIAVETARAVDLPTLEVSRSLEMEPMLDKLGVLLGAGKALGKLYDVDLDAALDGVETRVLSSTGDRAVVEVRYPLLGQEIRFEQTMERVDGAWYRVEALDEVRAALASEADAPAVAAPAAEPAPAVAP